jgi:2,3-dihydroxybenzoate-AMP ligase
VTPADLEQVLEATGMARYKLPERLIVRDALPLTAIGKIDKKALRADAADGIFQIAHLPTPAAASATLDGAGR